MKASRLASAILASAFGLGSFAAIAEVPAPQDIPFNGTLKINVDASDVARRVFRVQEVVPAQAGPLTLLYPQWLPGNHSPTGPVDKLAGLVVKDVRNPRVAKLALIYAIICQFVYLAFLIYMVKTCVLVATRYPQIVQRAGEAFTRIASAGGIGAAIVEIVRLGLSSSVLLFVAIVVSNVLIRLVRRRQVAKTAATMAQ